MAESIQNISGGTQPRIPLNVHQVRRVTGFSESFIYKHARINPQKWGAIREGKAIRFKPEAIDRIVGGELPPPARNVLRRPGATPDAASRRESVQAERYSRESTHATGRPVLIATIEGDATRVSLVCRDRDARQRLEFLIPIIKHLIDAALEHGVVGTA